MLYTYVYITVWPAVCNNIVNAYVYIIYTCVYMTYVYMIYMGVYMIYAHIYIICTYVYIKVWPAVCNKNNNSNNKTAVVITFANGTSDEKKSN